MGRVSCADIRSSVAVNFGESLTCFAVIRYCLLFEGCEKEIVLLYFQRKLPDHFRTELPAVAASRLSQRKASVDSIPPSDSSGVFPFFEGFFHSGRQVERDSAPHRYVFTVFAGPKFSPCVT